MNGFSSDVNILIGFYYETHDFHDKIEKFFSSIKEKYKTYVILESVEKMFENKISQWNQNAISLIISTISQVRFEIKGEIDIVEFNKIIDKRIDMNLNELFKTDSTINSERVRDIINQVIAKYTYYDLTKHDAIRRMMMEFYVGKEEDMVKIFDDLKNLIKKYFAIGITSLKFNDKIRKNVREYFEKAGTRDIKDDERIAEDLLCNYENKIDMFVTADNLFCEILRNIVKNGNFEGLEIVNLLKDL